MYPGWRNAVVLRVVPIRSQVAALSWQEAGTIPAARHLMAAPCSSQRQRVRQSRIASRDIRLVRKVRRRRQSKNALVPLRQQRPFQQTPALVMQKIFEPLIL